MPLSNEVRYTAFTSRFKSLVKENECDVVLGAMQVSEGVLVLLFSHRFNKEMNLLVIDGPTTDGVSKILKQSQEMISNAE